MQPVAASSKVSSSTKVGALLLLGVVAACSFHQPTVGTGGKKPYFGNFYCDSNSTGQHAVFVAQARFQPGSQGRGLREKGGALYRVLEVRRAKPGKRVCFRWPWVADEGRVGMVVGADTTWREWFNPWQPD